MADEKPMYFVDEEGIEDALATLLDQLRQHNPGLTSIKTEFADGSVVNIKLRGKPPKRHQLQVGATVTTGGQRDAR